MSIVFDTVSGVFTGKISLKDMKKSLDKQIVKNVYAPQKKSECKAIKSNYDKQIKEVSASTKTALIAISNQLDTTIKGNGRKAIEAAIKEHSSAYDNL